MAQETYDIGLTYIFLQYISEIDVFEHIRGIAGKQSGVPTVPRRRRLADR